MILKHLIQRHPVLLAMYVLFFVTTMIASFMMIKFIVKVMLGTASLVSSPDVEKVILAAGVLGLPIFMIGLVEGIKRRSRSYGLLALSTAILYLMLGYIYYCYVLQVVRFY